MMSNNKPKKKNRSFLQISLIYAKLYPNKKSSKEILSRKGIKIIKK